MSFSESEQNALLSVAKQSIEHGLSHGVQKPFDSSDLEAGLGHLNIEQACFVTLNKKDQLRGCIGSLEATRPLIEDVSHNAFNAAFRDPRFNPLTAHELDQLNIGLSVLTPPEAIPHCPTMEDLLTQLRPQQDGLIISDGFRRATFLPSVWEQLPEKAQFVQYLMRKAGMTAWSQEMSCERYSSLSFSLDWHEIES